jgi:hypothetical protein
MGLEEADSREDDLWRRILEGGGQGRLPWGLGRLIVRTTCKVDLWIRILQGGG